MSKILFLIVAFGCLGITVEIFFTAFYYAFQQIKKKEPINYSMMGDSYIWMFFIYGFAGFLFYLGFDKIAHLPIVARLLIYLLFIYGIEYITGWLLEKLIGKCPWEYHHPWAVHGYIRLDYAPFWLVFGLLIETAYCILDSSVVL